jgi:hypothetical protein
MIVQSSGPDLLSENARFARCRRQFLIIGWLTGLSSVAGLTACTPKPKVTQAGLFADRHASLLGSPLSGLVSRSGFPKEVVDSMMLDGMDIGMTELDLVAPLFPDLVLAKAKVEEARLEAALQKQDNDIAAINRLQESSFAFIGRIEARRSEDFAPGSANDSELLQVSPDPEILFTDVSIWPPRATDRLIAQLHEALRIEAQRTPGFESSALRAMNERPQFADYYGESAPRFAFSDCAPRFNPGEYVGNSDDIVAAIFRAAGWLRPDLKPTGALSDAEVAAVGASFGSNKKRSFADCARVFRTEYSRWEFDFLVAKEKVGETFEYFQEIHVRPRYFWLNRLFNGPLNGKPELQKTLIFRSIKPLPHTIHLRVFGNLAKPKALTIYNYKIGAKFDETTRSLILENFGIKWEGLKRRLVAFAKNRGLDVKQIDGQNIDDINALFRIARVWNFVNTTRRTLVNAASTVAAGQLLANGIGDLAAYDISEILAPAPFGQFATSLFLGVVVPGAVLTRRAVDSLEVDYLVQVMRSTKNPALRRAIERLQIFDLVMAGIAVGNGAFFVKDNWESITGVFYTTHVFRALSEAYALFRNGRNVSSELYGKLLSENEALFSNQRVTLEKILSQSRERMLNAFNKKMGTNLKLVDSVHKLGESLRNLRIYKEAAATDQESEERAAQIEKLLGDFVDAAYCEVLRSDSIAEFLKDGQPNEEARRLEAVNTLQDAFACGDAGKPK